MHHRYPSISLGGNLHDGRGCRVKLVGGIPTPLKNMSSSVGIILPLSEWKNEVHVPNHQRDKSITLW